MKCKMVYCVVMWKRDRLVGIFEEETREGQILLNEIHSNGFIAPDGNTERGTFARRNSTSV